MRLLLILFYLLLTGCSVTIDDVNELSEQEQQQQPITEQTSEVVEEDTEDTEPQPFLGFIKELLPFTKGQTVQYLALGDSLTRGIGDEQDLYGFSGRLATYLEEQPAIDEVILDNRGKNGRRSDQLLNLLERGHYDEALKNANFITITLGGNDVMKVVKSNVFNLKEQMFMDALQPFEDRYAAIMKEIRAHNADAPIIIVGFYNPFAIITDESEVFEGVLSAWNGTIEQVAKNDVNACFVPVTDLLMSNDDLVYHTDFFHPNAKGYERMTTRVIEQMKSCDIEKMSDGLIVVEE